MHRENMQFGVEREGYCVQQNQPLSSLYLLRMRRVFQLCTDRVRLTAHCRVPAAPGKPLFISSPIYRIKEPDNQ